MPAFPPQAYYLIPASAYGHGALPMLLPAAAVAVPQRAPHSAFVPEQQQRPAALEAQMPAETPNHHMREHPQQGGMQGGDPLEPKVDREVVLAAVEQPGREPDAKTRTVAESGKQRCQRLLHVANSLFSDPMSICASWCLLLAFALHIMFIKHVTSGENAEAINMHVRLYMHLNHHSLKRHL